MCRRITSQLIGALGKQEDASVQLEALDILSDMLGRSLSARSLEGDVPVTGTRPAEGAVGNESVISHVARPAG